MLDGQESFQLAERLTREFLGGIVDEFKAGGVEQMSRQQLEDIIREEMDILRNLADGSALSEHMEDCYLGALQLALVGQVSGKEQE